MSGRLVILPKKSYCPWNPQNVERVLRDERLERERQQQEAEAAQKQQRRPWQQLVPKETISTTTTTASASTEKHNENDSNQPATLQHFNLFAAEEMAMLEASVRGNTTPAAPKGIMAVPLGGDAVITSSHQQHQLPFYLRPAAASSSTCTDIMDATTMNYSQTGPSSNPATTIQQRNMKKEERLKAQMDPMHAFHSHHDDNFESSKFPPSSSTALVVIEEQPPTMKEDSIVTATTDQRRRRRRRHRRHRDDDSTSSSQDDVSEQKDDLSRERRRKRKKLRHDNDDGERDRRRRHRSGDDNDRRHHRRRKHHRRERTEDDDDAQHQHHDTPNKISASANDNKQQPSLEELRERRAQREAKEAQRQLAVVQEVSSSHYDSSLPRRGYHNQFNPTLSRK